MAEFKVNDQFEKEITAVKTSVKDIDTKAAGYSDNFIKTLPVSEKYKEEQASLRRLVKLYMQLLEKDVSDLEIMYETAKNMDNTLSDSLN